MSAPAARRMAWVWRLRQGRLAVASVNVLNRCSQACPMCGVHEGPDQARGAR